MNKEEKHHKQMLRGDFVKEKNKTSYLVNKIRLKGQK